MQRQKGSASSGAEEAKGSGCACCRAPCGRCCHCCCCVCCCVCCCWGAEYPATAGCSLGADNRRRSVIHTSVTYLLIPSFSYSRVRSSPSTYRRSPLCTYCRTTPARLPEAVMLCHSVRSGTCVPSLFVYPFFVVARVRFATSPPPSNVLLRGSPPTLPSSITLFIPSMS